MENLSEIKSIAKEAYIYGFPVVDSYRIEHAYNIDTNNPEYKGKFNVLKNIPRVYTPEDKAVQTPNSDTPYSMIEMDLRKEPMVISLPVIDKNRYFSVQLIDLYTHNFYYLGSRTTGNDGGEFLVAGPDWNGEAPGGIKKIIRSETQFVTCIFRTQLFNPEDLENVKKVQEGYKVQTLSSYLGKQDEEADTIDFIIPLTPELQKKSTEFFNILNFQLQFCPVHHTEIELRERFAKIGIEAGKKIDFDNLPDETKKAYEEGIAEAWKEYGDFVQTKILTDQVTSGDIFGTREFLKNNYMYRMTAAVLGIYGNSAEEAMYPSYKIDSDGNIPDGSKNKYTIHFNKGQLPPVNAFWSLTMYEVPSSLLCANPINRYLINSPMLPDMKTDNDGGLTIYIQHDSPGADLESNWLPAPNGPFAVVLRLYWPKPEAVIGSWKQPTLKKV
ncbi:MAG: DUF1254 domain-containing protein [Ignavibacteria bacterium]|nr:DUF1254 domain-containing protein [Ignavibacteria bacterium]